MLRHLTRIFTPSLEIQHAYALYAHINAESRNARFFESFGVPDTLDGRFEMIVAHLFCYLHSLKGAEEDTTTLQRLLIEAFFEDMDRSVRELGVGDTGVSRRIKAMANAFYGRLNVYEQGLEDDEKLLKAVRTNIYGTLPEGASCDVPAMAAYLRTRLSELQGQEVWKSEYLQSSTD